jgi:hypothetical protein
LRNRVSLNPNTKLLEMNFDLAVTAPAGRRVLDVLREVFGDKLDKDNWNAPNMEGMIVDLLSGLYVARNYPHGGQNTSSNVARTWKVPFPIGQVKLSRLFLRKLITIHTKFSKSVRKAHGDLKINRTNMTYRVQRDSHVEEQTPSPCKRRIW